MTRVVRRSWRPYGPTVLAAVVTGWLCWRGVSVLAGSSGLSRTIDSGRTELMGPSVLVFLLAVMALERVWPAVARPLLARGQLQDALYLLVYAVAVIPLVVLIGVGFSNTLGRVAPWLELPRAPLVPRWLVVVVALVAIDGCNWLAHFANHRWRALWRLHAVHHSQEEMSVLTTFRTHPLVHLSFLVTAVPAFVLLANGVVPPLVLTGYVCMATLPHANLSWSFGPLGRLIVSPAYHRLHHSRSGRIDVNMGSVLTVWDLVSGRAIFPLPGTAPCATGLARRPVPVEQASPHRRPLSSLARQMAEPFVVGAPSSPDGRSFEAGRRPRQWDRKPVSVD